MIADSDVADLILEACPSFAASWDPSENVDEKGRLLYVDAMDLCGHLRTLADEDQTAEFPAVFDLIERLHIEGNPYVQELATIGFLECLHPDERFVPWLRPVSRRWWDRVDRYWSGDHSALNAVDP